MVWGERIIRSGSSSSTLYAAGWICVWGLSRTWVKMLGIIHLPFSIHMLMSLTFSLCKCHKCKYSLIVQQYCAQPILLSP